MKTEGNKKQVAIQKRIEEVMDEEFDKMIEESTTDPLLKLIREGKIDRLSLPEIKDYLKGTKNE
jgi:hypothetical protein